MKNIRHSKSYVNLMHNRTIYRNANFFSWGWKKRGGGLYVAMMELCVVGLIYIFKRMASGFRLATRWVDNLVGNLLGIFFLIHYFSCLYCKLLRLALSLETWYKC